MNFIGFWVTKDGHRVKVVGSDGGRVFGCVVTESGEVFDTYWDSEGVAKSNPGMMLWEKVRPCEYLGQEWGALVEEDDKAAAV